MPRSTSSRVAHLDVEGELRVDFVLDAGSRQNRERSRCPNFMAGSSTFETRGGEAGPLLGLGARAAGAPSA